MVVALTTISCSKDEPITEEQSTDLSIDLSLANKTDWQMAQEILTVVNEHRASINLPALRLDRRYASAYAVAHTDYMISNDQISHDNFSERSSGLRSQGASKVGETVAYGYQSADALVNAWLNSPSHKKVLEGNYTHAGFGVVPNEDGNLYFTQLFYQK